jgi:hypothetical protein
MIMRTLQPFAVLQQSKNIAMTINQPMTMVTDFILGVVALICGVSLLRSKGYKSKTLVLWSTGFFSAAAAAVLGGTFHGFGGYQSPRIHNALWNVILLLIGVSSGFLISASISGWIGGKPEVGRWLLAGISVTAVGLAVQISGASLHPSFNYNDLYHCAQTIGLYCVFRGASLTR